MSDLAELEALIARTRGFVAAAAPAAAGALAGALQAAAGPNATIGVAAQGTQLVVTVDSPDPVHDAGTLRRGELPAHAAAAVEASLRASWEGA